MDEPQVGFEIQGRFYPWVGFDNWKHKEIRAVRAVTGYNPRELLLGQASGAEVNLAFATVSFWRGHPEIDEHELVPFMEELTPSDIGLKGFDTLKGNDAGPPDEPLETSGNEPSANTAPSSESIPESSPQKPTGDQPSPTGSTSGPQSQSES
jgi:hypothetical protein